MTAVETATDGAHSAVGTATLVFAAPGRIRFRLDSIRGDVERAAAVEQSLAKLDFADQVRASSLTGSVIFHYSPDAAGTVDVLEEVALALDVDIEQPPHSTAVASRLDSHKVAAGVRNLVRQSNTRVAAATGGLDLRVIVPGVLFCLGVGALLGSRRRQMPAWHTLIWYAYNTFDKLNRGPQDMEDLTDG